MDFKKITNDIVKTGQDVLQTMANGLTNGILQPVGVSERGIPIQYSVNAQGQLTIQRNVIVDNDFVKKLSKSKIGNFCNLNYQMGLYRERLMNLNDREISITLASLGADALYGGNSNSYTANRTMPSYAENRNYTDKFAVGISGVEDIGSLTTRVGINKSYSPIQNYGNHNELYGETQNLYYDENDMLYNRIDTRDSQDSLLAKTKRLFQEKKINTIISRFHTENAPAYKGDKRSVYGLSHGRNLLTKTAESSGGSSVYLKNGYNNPYCRVWTHHYQYDRLYKTMRPFGTVNENEGVTMRSLADLHKWKNFKTTKDISKRIGYGVEDGGVYTEWVKYNMQGWKDDTEDLWKNTVMGNSTNGMVNITPKYVSGGNSNIHTKNCMFSIENLAWKGYDPYSFETALSWEQRGPNGGRIMWFPPYGISFNETTTAKWNVNSFIGRGEDVYTYVNTTRQGTLNFMMVVDHPSIVDYVAWDNQNQHKVSDADVLRFFAGCDSGDSEDPDSLISNAKPTPLTDEYIEETFTESVTFNEPPVPPAPYQNDVSEDEELEIATAVFFPNNYSGYYDDDKQGGSSSVVDPIAYLLAGKGAQKEMGQAVNGKKYVKTVKRGKNYQAIYNNAQVKLTKDIPISFEELDKSDGCGYEMGGGTGITDNNYSNSGNYIVGTESWFYNHRRPSNGAYTPLSNKIWTYRTDGKYEFAPESEFYKNTYDQNVTFPAKDNKSCGYNCDANAIKSKVNFNEETTVYSFAEIAAAITTKESVRTKIKENSGDKINFESDEFKKLVTFLQQKDGYKVTEILINGVSNSHGSNSQQSVNDKRNTNLAEQRARTVGNWLKTIFTSTDIKYTETTQVGVKVADSDKSNTSGADAKSKRCAVVTFKIKREGKTTFNKTKFCQYIGEYMQYNNDLKDYLAYPNFKPDGLAEDGKTQLYTLIDDDNPKTKGKKWYFVSSDPEDDKSNGEMRLWNPDELVSRGGFDTDGNVVGDVNTYRYDQEYHFFKVLERKDPIVFESLMNKLQYFDPAFHSMTPEGFNGRLTFLQQCMRQGNTVGASDNEAKSANNLAFGMQPYCILRLGDFYNQMIVINNISFTYDPLVWDLNSEGIGVQPLICNVSMSFSFIGGGDIGGCVRRLQNAMTFNYYANTSLYDNRADRINIKWDPKTNGAITQGEITKEGTYMHDVNMYGQPSMILNRK